MNRRGIRKLMGVLGNSFTVDMDEQNQRHEFHRAYVIFQQDIITEFSQFGFDLQGLHGFATLLWKKYKKFGDRCLGIETAFDLMNKKREMVKKILLHDNKIKMFDKKLNEYCSGELRFGAKINNIKADPSDEIIKIKIFNRSAVPILARVVPCWPLVTKTQHELAKNETYIPKKSENEVEFSLGCPLLLFEEDKPNKPISAYKACLGKNLVIKVEGNLNTVVSDDLEPIAYEDLVMMADAVKYKLFIGGENEWQGVNFTKFMVAKTTIPGEEGPNPNLSKQEMKLYQMQEIERKELEKTKGDNKTIVINLQMSVGDSETNKLSEGYFSGEKYKEEAEKFRRYVKEVCGRDFYVSINTMDDDKYYEGVFDVWCYDQCLWKKDFRRPWPPYKGLCKQITHYIGSIDHEYLQT